VREDERAGALARVACWRAHSAARSSAA
jgi:hypothetical protein